LTLPGGFIKIDAVAVAIAPVDLLAQIESGRAPVILDVRSRKEYERGHVPGALHAPFWRVRSMIPRLHLRPDTPLVVYCGHGPRARIAAAALRVLGFQTIAYLGGHMARWTREGLREERT
jgi:rhodanese-related sulfurtransferase